MKNSLKRAASLIALGVVATSACSLNAFAEGDSKFSADGGYSATEIGASTVKPTITASKKVITLAEAKDAQQIDITVSGADGKYCSTGMHVYYDSRLEIALNRANRPDVKIGEAGEMLVSKPADIDPTAADYKMEGFFVTTAGDDNLGFDGTLWTFNVNLPADAKEGDVYPIDIVYRSNATNEDLFVNKEVNAEGKLMQAYAWTQGIYNADFNNNFKADAADIAKCAGLADISKSADGYIAIAAPPVTTTTPPVTTTTTPPVTTTTTPPVTTTTIAIVTTTTAPVVTTTDSSVVTSTTTDKVTTEKATTTKKTTAKKTTAKKTTAKKDDSPKTGVAGVGVAVAGLAVALGTAFVLRKKED